MITEAIREQMTKTIKYIQPVQYASATGLTAEVYRQMQADFLPVPPLTLHSPAPEVMAGVWSILRESLSAGHVDRALKEAVAATVSQVNECPYCVEVHTSMLHATAAHDAADSILRGAYHGIHDSRIHSVVQWILDKQAAKSNGGSLQPFSRSDAAELIGTAVAFHYINRMVNVFLEDTFVPVPSALKGLSGRLFGATAGRRFIRPIKQGDSLKFVPSAKLPDDLSWAASNPAVAGAFAGFAQVIEETGQKILPEPVRALVREHIQAWNGEAMGLSRRWVEDAVVDIRKEYRASARLMLLTALASYQVDSNVVEDFRSQYPDDAQLIAATSWASFTAARRVGSWMSLPEM
jgi:AhpD family alkylhydroperoxidase